MENDIKNERFENNPRMLEKILQISEENNTLLKKIRRQQKISNWFRIIYWLLILASILGLYYFLNPIVSDFFTDFSNMKNTVNNFSNGNFNLQDSELLRNIFRSFSN